MTVNHTTIRNETIKIFDEEMSVLNVDKIYFSNTKICFYQTFSLVCLISVKDTCSIFVKKSFIKDYKDFLYELTGNDYIVCVYTEEQMKKIDLDDFVKTTILETTTETDILNDLLKCSDNLKILLLKEAEDKPKLLNFLLENRV